jgi:DNA end-binding protein Ku
MPARSIASINISFGLVSIPVNLYSATESSSGIHFNLLHATCGSRVQQQYVCAKEGVVVERSEMVKGYEFAKGQYVQFTPEEIKALEAVGSASIDISDFVPLESIDPIFFDKSYYLAPDKGGAKPYALLVQALTASKLSAVGHYAARGKQYVVSLRPAGDVLIMQQLHFQDEVRPASEFEVPPVKVGAKELQLAKQLIDQQTIAAFDPAAYTDDVKARLEKAIEKKVAGEEISVSDTPRPSGTNVIDLMETLRASLKAVDGKGKTKPAAARKPPKRATTATPARKTGKG